MPPEQKREINLVQAITYPFRRNNWINTMLLPGAFLSLLCWLTATNEASTSPVKSLLTFSMQLLCLGPIGYLWRLLGVLRQSGYDTPAPDWTAEKSIIALFDGLKVFLLIGLTVFVLRMPDSMQVFRLSKATYTSTGNAKLDEAIDEHFKSQLSADELTVAESQDAKAKTIEEINSLPANEKASAVADPDIAVILYAPPARNLKSTDFVEDIILFPNGRYTYLAPSSFTERLNASWHSPTNPDRVLCEIPDTSQLESTPHNRTPRAVVEFTVMKDESAIKLHLAESSGDSIFDDAVLDAVKNAGAEEMVVDDKFFREFDDKANSAVIRLSFTPHEPDRWYDAFLTANGRLNPLSIEGIRALVGILIAPFIIACLVQASETRKLSTLLDFRKAWLAGRQNYLKSLLSLLASVPVLAGFIGWSHLAAEVSSSDKIEFCALICFPLVLALTVIAHLLVQGFDSFRE